MNPKKPRFNELSSLLEPSEGGTIKSNYDISGGGYSLNRGKSSFNLLNCEIYQIEF